MNFFGPINVMSLGRKSYSLVMVDDFTKYTWVDFLASKDEAPQLIIEHIKNFNKEAERKGASVVAIRIDKKTEFRIATLKVFSEENNLNNYLHQGNLNKIV